MLAATFNMRDTKMKKKLAVLFLILSLLWCALILRYEIKGVINALFPPRPCEEISLTEEEKIEDFLFVYETVVSSMPALKEYERIYGISFREKTAS